MRKKSLDSQFCKTSRKLIVSWRKTSSKTSHWSKSTNREFLRMCFKRKSKKTTQPQLWPWSWRKCILLETLSVLYKRLDLLRPTRMWIWPGVWWLTIQGLCHTKTKTNWTWTQLCIAHPSSIGEIKAPLTVPRCRSRTSLRLALTWIHMNSDTTAWTLLSASQLRVSGTTFLKEAKDTKTIANTWVTITSWNKTPSCQWIRMNFKATSTQ